MKVSRQAKIIELITDNVVETQEDLAELLMKAGYQVTQATVSRDIRELKLTKVAVDNGKQKYIELKKQEDVLIEKYVHILQNGFVSMDKAMNIIVVRTVSGMAMAVAAAMDALHIDGIVGCIAGDDTIMCAVRSLKDTDIVMHKLSKIAKAKEKKETNEE
jgi:transcriptional regulator of arginine metabolism